MSRLALALLLSPLFFALSPAGAARDADDAAEAGDDGLVEKARKAIDLGVEYLRSRQDKEGKWDPPASDLGGHAGGNHGGYTALTLLALLNAGVAPDDPAFQRGLAFLRKVKTNKTYVVGLRLMVFAQASPKDQDLMKADVKYLEESLMAEGWAYFKMPDPTVKNVADNSNSQYALLGLHEANLAGVPVSEKTLKAVQALYRKSQNPDGGWAYKPASKGSILTMTAAGMCNLLIAGEDLNRGKAKLREDGSADDCGVYDENEHLTKGLDWLGERFPATITDTNLVARLVHPFYALYGLERAGRLTGHRFFGGHDWYEVGTRYLVKAQKDDGHWAGPGGTLDRDPLVATSFAVLFLSKGRTPVLLTKLAHGPIDGTGWNNKRSDLKHLSEFCSKALFDGKPVAWQAFDVRTTEAGGEAGIRRLAAQLLQSPIVFFNGHTTAPRGKEADILREYVNNGGFILAENCCGSKRFPKFEEDLKDLVRKLFKDDAKLEPLEPEHPLWLASGKFASSPKDFPLMGVKLGCKTVMVYSPVPIAGYWEANEAKEGPGRKAFELGANVVAYATGLEAPRPRLTRVELTATGAKEAIKRGYLQVGQLRHEGDWQPAPKAMRNVMAEARKAGLDVLLKTEPLFPSDERVLDHRFLYMHGRGAFAAKREDLKHLRFALRNGGMLLADACCGAEKFDGAFRAFAEELFGDEKLKLEPVPADDPLYGKELNGAAIGAVKRRAKGKKGFESAAPALEGIRYKGRWVVLYSKWDIGCALEKHTSPECVGHDHDSAARLARAAVLYALTR